MQAGLLTVLTLGASLSPLLTSAHLWQIKEWRWDRLREHFLEEGILRQIFGFIRPLIVAVGLLLPSLAALPIERSVVVTLAVLTGLTLAQVMLRKQQKPVWTQKAKAICALTLVLTTLTTLPLSVQTDPVLLMGLPLVVLLQPIFLGLALLLLTPLDGALKRRIFRRAEHLRSQCPDLTVIGITGSVGKTTTKELLAHVLSDRHPLVTPAYVNSDMGVAQWILKVLRAPQSPSPQTPLPRGEGLAIIEMGAYRVGEIALLCRIAKPTLGIVTHVGLQHLALFGSKEAIAQAKSELPRSLPPDGHAFLNGDSAITRAMAPLCPCPVTIVSTGGRSDIEAYDIAETMHGISFTALEQRFDVPLHGTHNVANVLLTIAVASHLGMKPAEIALKLRTFSPLSHTFAVAREGTVTVLDDTHNSSLASIEAAIEWARQQPAKGKILLASGLIELGEEREQAHKRLGSMASGIFQRVVVTHPRSAKELQAGYDGTVEVLSRETKGVPEDSLLVCCGRIPLSMITRLLPPS